MRTGGEHSIEVALEALRRALDDEHFSWMIVGGIAVIARGVRRMTTDIDAVVAGPGTPIPALLDALARGRIEPRIDDAVAFARRNLVLLLRHRPTGVDLDVSLGWSSFEQEAIGACEVASYGRVKAPMATAGDLMVFKAVAARPRDIADLEALLLLHPAVDLARVRDRVGQLALLADVPELSDGLEAAIAKARSTAKGARRRRIAPPGAARKKKAR